MKKTRKEVSFQELGSTLGLLFKDLAVPATGIDSMWIHRLYAAKAVREEIRTKFGEQANGEVKRIEELYLSGSGMAAWEVRDTIRFGLDWVLWLEKELQSFDRVSAKITTGAGTESQERGLERAC